MMSLDKKLSMVRNNQDRIAKIKTAIQQTEKTIAVNETALVCTQHNMMSDMKLANTPKDVNETHERFMCRKVKFESSIKEDSIKLSRLKSLLSAALRHEKTIYAM